MYCQRLLTLTILLVCHLTLISQNNGICDPGESSSHPDCNGICDPGELASSTDCNGICNSNETASSVDCNGICGAGDAPLGPDCINLCNPDPLMLSTNESCDQSTTGTSANTPPWQGDFCGTPSAAARFYRFNATESTSHTIEISAAAELHMIAVFDDCTTSNPLICGLTSIDIVLQDGESYIIAIYPENSAATSTYDLCIYIPTNYDIGNVGVNTTDPRTRLDVNGGIRPGFTVNEVAGNIRWFDDLEVYNGVAWKSITAWDQIATQTIQMQGNGLTGLPLPVAPSDAATKAYVDNSSDADNDPSNELQTLTQGGNVVVLSKGGGTISVADFDNDNQNEIQTLSAAGGLITLSDGGGSVSNNDADSNPNNELQSINRSGTLVTLSNGGGSVSIADLDNSPSNELQTLSQSGSTVTLSDNGGSISIDDADADTDNELQTLSQTGSMVTLSDNGGSIDVGDLSTSNELQTLSQSGSTVTLSDSGGSIDVGDLSTSNELQTLSQSGSTITLSDGGGSIDVGDLSTTNELQTLSRSGTTVSLSNGGNINLANLATQWETVDTRVYYDLGNVGIGQSEPSELLDVGGTTQIMMNSSGSAPHLQLVENSSTDGARINFESSVETNNSWTLYGKADNTLADNVFNLFHSVSGNILRVRGNGDIGINGNPDTDLHVYHGNNGAEDGLKIQNGSNTNPWWRIYVSSASSDLRLYSKSQGSTILGAFNEVSGAYSALSDERYKEDVSELAFNWAGFMSMRPLSYRYTGSGATQRSIGMLAQEVLQVYPELVTYISENDQYLLNYSGLGTVAIKAIQEQQKEIETLKTENALIKQELSDIKAMIKQLSQE